MLDSYKVTLADFISSYTMNTTEHVEAFVLLLFLNHMTITK